MEWLRCTALLMVDNQPALELLVSQLCEVSAELPLVFPMHPRTSQRLEAFGLRAKLLGSADIKLTEPMGYVEFMSLVSQAALVITDSGGVQEETMYLSIPCLTVRETTERPITIQESTNRLVRPEAILQTVRDALQGDWPKGRVPRLWDGRTAERVAQSLKAHAGIC